MEARDVKIARVMHHKLGKFGRPGGVPYLIARTTTGLTIKGQVRASEDGDSLVGMEYRLWGEMKPQKDFPDAFEFSEYSELCSRTTGGMAAYLSRHVYGIGPVKAKAIVKSSGVDTLDILRVEPGRIAEIPGVRGEDIESIRLHFNDKANRNPADIAKMVDLLDGYKFPKSTPKKAVEIWGSAAVDVIKDDPYLLMDFPRVGWKLVDPFATGKLEYPEDGEHRHRAAIVESLTRLSEDGHTCASMAEMMTTTETLLGSTLRDDALPSAIDQGYITIYESETGTVYQLRDLSDAEDFVASQLVALREYGPPPISGLVTPAWVAEHSLGDDQVEAARHIAENPVSILTGGPGTGKSFTLSRVVQRLLELGHRSIRCMAPTGKAAKRTAILLAEVGITGIPCTTIHKALEPGMQQLKEEGVPQGDAKFNRGKDGWTFARGPNNPLDEKTLVIEECSMLDSKLQRSLFSAIALGTRVIIVGDPDQLQSVGPGATLRDMIKAGIPTARLTEIRRSDQAGDVVHACHDMIAGRTPRHSPKIQLPLRNWGHIELDDPIEIADKIVEINVGLKTFDRMWETQVISPRKDKMPFACERLNYLLSRALNPENRHDTLLTDPDTGETIGGLDVPPVVGDKIVRTKNGIVDELVESVGNRADISWDGKGWKAIPCAVVNGDTGVVVDILSGNKPGYIVRFRDPDRMCYLPISDSHIEMAYCMTVHKMQGSGAKCIIAPIHNSFYFDEKAGKGLWMFELFFTLISRMEVLLITVGQWSAAMAACKRRTIDRRQTTLADRIRRAVPAAAPTPYRYTRELDDAESALDKLESEFVW